MHKQAHIVLQYVTTTTINTARFKRDQILLIFRNLLNGNSKSLFSAKI